MEPSGIWGNAVARKPARALRGASTYPLGDAAASSTAQTMMKTQVAERRDPEMLTLHVEVQDLRQRLENLSIENGRLKEGLAMANRETEDAHEAMQNMISDLITAQRDLEEKNNSVTNLKEEASKLSSEKVNLEMKAMPIFEPRPDMQEEVEHLKSQLTEKESQIDELRKDTKHTIERIQDFWQQKVDEQKSGFDAKLAEVQEKATAEISTHKSNCQEAESRLELLAKNTSSGQQKSEGVSQQAAIELQDLQRRQATHLTEVEDLRRLMNFYKQNSEWLSRQTGELTAGNVEMRESLKKSEEAVEELTAIIMANSKESGKKLPVRHAETDFVNDRRRERRAQRALQS